MLLPKFIKSASLILLLPAVGVSVAATATTALKTAQLEGEATESTTPVVVASAPVADGRQDTADYSYVVKISEEGTVRGRVAKLDAEGNDVGASGMPVTISQAGQIVQDVTTDAGGYFTLNNLLPGVYSLVGKDADSMVAFGFYAVGGPDEVVGVSSLARELQIDTVASSAADYAAINKIRRHYLPSVELLPGEDSNENHYAKALRQSYLIRTATAPINMDDVARESEGKPAAAALQPQSVVITDGELKGQLSQIMGEEIDFRFIHCFLIDRGSVVAEVPADETGAFTMTGIKAGEYSFVAAGTGGFATFSVQLTDGASVQLETAGDTQFVSAPATSAATTLAVALAAQDAPEVIVGIPAGGDDDDDDGGFLFIGGGGGGGGGGFGGLGGLTALGLGAAAIAIAADDNDNQSLASGVFVN